MFTKSIRWRLQLWLGFLLMCVLSGFCVAVYQVQRVHQFQQIDDELDRRVAALGAAMRGGPPPMPGMPGRDGGPFNRREPADFPDPPPGRPPGPPRDRSGFPPGEGGRPGPREFRVSPELIKLFDEASTNGFYFVAWSREGSVLKRSSNAPANVPFPESIRGDTRTHTRVRESFREAFHFTELRD